jgi:hypothetical protein
MVLLPILLWGCKQTQSTERTYKADVIIYGGTSAAVTAAVQVTKMGKSVVIVSPARHLGGLTSSGLGYTDTGKKEVIGGLTREFYQRIYQYYQKPETWVWQKRKDYGNKGQGTVAMDGEFRTMWIFEPHIAENVFNDFIREYDVPVYQDQWLDRESGVMVEKGTIKSITCLSGQTFIGKIFIDATYEGDLMAAAGVSFHVGREAADTYGEEWNGIQTGVLHHGHHFGEMNISPFNVPDKPESGVLPRISTDPPGIKGQGDNKLQAYCYRLCLTAVEGNRIPFKRPIEYDSTQYELLLRVLDAGWRETFYKFDPIPNLKTDVNNHGPFSSDNIGMNYDYPEASYERRHEILDEHKTYQAGLLYFLANDLRVPDDVQAEISRWGLSKDEFQDNGHWPYQIYVREARRMIGAYVMTEHEILDHTEVNQSIGMGSYTMDSHNVQRYITPAGYVQNEGDLGVSVPKPYQIALGSILPQANECTNLLVPMALSSSHIAFGSIRMEPVFMVLGQSAGTLASMAIDGSQAVQEITYPELRIRLLEFGQVLEFDP